MKKNGDFTQNLGKIYSIYTGGFLGFVVVLAILEQLGVPNQYIGYAFIFLTIGIYAAIGILSRTTHVPEYYVAGRKVPPVYRWNIFSPNFSWGWQEVSICFQVTMAFQSFSLGWTGLAHILVAILLAPYLRK